MAKIFISSEQLSVKFSGKMRLIIVLKVTKNQGFALSLEDTSLEKPKSFNNCVMDAVQKLLYREIGIE